MLISNVLLCLNSFLCMQKSVVAHEYFHNWTGNRVTCRDWFQLTLKEGLTVYRDQEFSADMVTFLSILCYLCCLALLEKLE